ncbi:MAG TPA: hypothetical protein VK982_16270 [Bacteroidales bacterium]|nr:hypothetical protein [Bacteroidales bacterium]
MKKIFLLSICLIIVKISFSFEPRSLNGNNTVKLSFEEDKQLLYAPNYQQFKTQLLNIEINEVQDYAQLRRRGKDDYLMLYVAGGIVIATATLILTNNPNNFVSNTSGGVNTGIAIAGGIASGLIVTKFIIDQNR